MPATSSAVYRRSIDRPEMVVKGPVRSGDLRRVGSSTSRVQRALSLVAGVTGVAIVFSIEDAHAGAVSANVRARGGRRACRPGMARPRRIDDLNAWH